MSSVTQPSRLLPPVVSSMSSLASGVSEEATRLFKVFEDCKTHLFQSVNGQSLHSTVNDLEITVSECSKSNWDGYGAEPISKEAASDATVFLRLLPSALARPEIVPEPDGDIGLEWHRSDNTWLIISFSGQGKINYAGKYGSGNRSKGTENFGNFIPGEIVEKIYRLFREES